MIGAKVTFDITCTENCTKEDLQKLIEFELGAIASIPIDHPLGHLFFQDLIDNHSIKIRFTDYAEYETI